MSSSDISTASWPRRSLQFSLGTLLVVVTLACVVAAAWASDLFYGILAYLICLLLCLGWLRVRAEHRFQVRLDTELHLEHFLRFSNGVMLAAGIALLAGFAFFGVMFVVDQIFLRLTVSPIRIWMRNASQDDIMRFVQVRTAVVIGTVPLSTLAAMLVYWLMWPKSKANMTDGSH